MRASPVPSVVRGTFGDERETFIDESGQQIQMSCHPMYRWLDRLMQGMMQKVIGDVRHSRRIKTLPFKATVHVGPSETDIESMHLQDVRERVLIEVSLGLREPVRSTLGKRTKVGGPSNLAWV